MDVFWLLICAVAPAIALMSYFYIRDAYDHEPLRLVALLFLTGMLSALPVMYAVDWIGRFVSSPLAQTVFVVAVFEELAKYGLTIWLAVRHREFDEEYDGIVYAVAASLGFATLENIIKVLNLGWESVPFRTLFAVPGHALFGVIMGYYLGKARFASTPRKRVTYFLIAFLSPWACHAVYDALLLTEQTLYVAMTLPFMIWLWVNGLRKVRAAQDRSPYKPQAVDPKGRATDV